MYVKCTKNKRERESVLWFSKKKEEKKKKKKKRKGSATFVHSKYTLSFFRESFNLWRFLLIIAILLLNQDTGQFFI